MYQKTPMRSNPPANSLPVSPRPGQLQIKDEVFDHWKLSYWPYYGSSGNLRMRGPLCIACKTPFDAITPESTEFNCTICGTVVISKKQYSELSQEAHRALEGYLLRGKPVVSLNMPASSVWSEDEDELHKIVVKLSQKNGKKVAKILILSKKDGGRKVDLFANIDSEELTRDPIDLPPGTLLASVTAVFKQTEQVVNYSEVDKKA